MALDLNFFKREFLAGGGAGAIGIMIGFPFDLVKVKLQAFPDKFASAWECFRSSLREDGFRGLYRGCIPPIATQGLLNSVMFLGDSATIRVLEPELQRGEIPGLVNSYIAGCVGGMLQCIIAVPTEVVKCTMQANTLNIGATSAATVATSHSSTVSQRTQSVSAAASSKNGRSQSYSTISAENSSRAVASRCNTTATATALRSTHSSSVHSNRTGALALTIANIQHIYRAEGLAGFYRGFGVTVIRDVPSIGLYFFVYKHTRDWLGRLERQLGLRGGPVRAVKGPTAADAADEEQTMFYTQPQPSGAATMVAGAVAGVLSWVSVYPVDVIKTNLQVYSPTTATTASSSNSNRNSASNHSNSSSNATVSMPPVKRTGYSVAVELYRQHGVKVFFRGLGTVVLRSLPVNSATFYFYEYFNELLHAQ